MRLYQLNRSPSNPTPCPRQKRKRVTLREPFQVPSGKVAAGMGISNCAACVVLSDSIWEGQIGGSRSFRELQKPDHRTIPVGAVFFVLLGEEVGDPAGRHARHAQRSRARHHGPPGFGRARGPWGLAALGPQGFRGARGSRLFNSLGVVLKISWFFCSFVSSSFFFKRWFGVLGWTVGEPWLSEKRDWVPPSPPCLKMVRTGT